MEKRRITLDRTDELARLMNLTGAEKIHFRNWIASLEETPAGPTGQVDQTHRKETRKEADLSLLSDWINVYVKDLFQLKEVQQDATLIYKHLAHIASPARIEKALQFLLRQGYLRRTMDGRIVIESSLAVADPKISSQKIRSFHKAALKIAQRSIDLYPTKQRLANTLTLTLNENSYEELLMVLEECSEKLMSFAESKSETNTDKLYQVTINLSPVGGQSK